MLSENKRHEYQVDHNETSTIKERWRHQLEAKEAFLKNRCGILEMATGTGKTRTAISILQHLVNSQVVKTVIITTIGTDLLDQWVEQLYEVASNLNPQFRVLRHYENYHQKDEYELDSLFSILVILEEDRLRTRNKLFEQIA